LEKKKSLDEYNKNLEQYNSAQHELANLKKAKELDAMLSDKSQN
jgi:hypothetical protein